MSIFDVFDPDPGRSGNVFSQTLQTALQIHSIVRRRDEVCRLVCLSHLNNPIDYNPLRLWRRLSATIKLERYVSVMYLLKLVSVTNFKWKFAFQLLSRSFEVAQIF